jgi:hypothetical protein
MGIAEWIEKEAGSTREPEALSGRLALCLLSMIRVQTRRRRGDLAEP